MSHRFYKHPYKGKYSFIKNWFDDREGLEFEQKIDKWLLQFDDEERDFLLECLKRYSYFRASEYKYAIKSLYYKFNSNNKDWQENSKMFMITNDNSRVSNSDEFVVNFWKINNIKNECCRDIEAMSDCFDLFETLILIDDYIGSANTTITFLERIYNSHPILKSKPLHILCLYLTKSGELALKNYATDNDLELTLYWYKKGDKFFKEGHYYSGQDLVTKIEIYNKIWEEKYGTSDGNFQFGYENTQSLFSLNNDTPNNTLGIFWKKSQDYSPLFKRYSEPPTSLDKLIKDRRAIDKAKKKQLWKDPIDSYKNLLFVGYCARKKTTFDFADACKRFNLTVEQLNTKLDYIIDKGYIRIENARFVETQDFWKSVKKLNCKKFFDDFINEVIDEKCLDVNITNYLPGDFEKRFNGYK